MSGMARNFLEHVRKDPPEIHHVTPTDLDAFDVRTDGGIEDGIGALTGQIVTTERYLDRPEVVVGRDEFLSIQTVQEPVLLDEDQMIHEPEQRRVRWEETTSGGIVPDARDLPDERVTLIVVEGAERRHLVGDQVRRTFISHADTIGRTTRARRNGRALVQR